MGKADTRVRRSIAGGEIAIQHRLGDQGSLPAYGWPFLLRGWKTWARLPDLANKNTGCLVKFNLTSCILSGNHASGWGSKKESEFSFGIKDKWVSPISSTGVGLRHGVRRSCRSGAHLQLLQRRGPGSLILSTEVLRVPSILASEWVGSGTSGIWLPLNSYALLGVMAS